MDAIDVRPLASILVEPWRNGGGVTRTLAANGTHWRVSLAQVERDGPYSQFEGMTRISFVLNGLGVTLHDGVSVVELAPFAAVEYDGGTAWTASLKGGPVTALNVMSATGRYRTNVQALTGATVVPPGCAAVAIALDTGCRYRTADAGAEGAIEAGHVMVVPNLDRPLRIAPSIRASTPGHDATPPVLVVIAPATDATID